MNLSKDSKTPLAELRKVHLTFSISKTETNTLKESFINFLRNPVDIIFASDNIFQCLQNINLKINDGDRIGLLGKNGSGKTSLCHLLTGNIRPTLGEATRNCKIRSIFSSTSHLYPDLSGRENARVMARLLYPYLGDKELINVANESIAFAELGQFSDVAVKNYSKGMSSRLLLSLLTTLPAELLIMDELFDGADQFFMEKFSPRLESIIEQSNAILFVNHNLEFLKKYCNRIIVLHNGEIFFDGLPQKGFFCYQSQSWGTNEHKS